MPFRAFWTAFMTTFHVVMYFPTSLASLVSPPCLLRIVDWSSCMPVFISNKASLAMLQTSNSWSNHFLWWSWMNACWVRGNRSNLSTQSRKSWRSLSLWHIDDDEVASEVFSLHKYSTICGISGCGSEGKLLERAWWVAMFSSSGLRMCRVECTKILAIFPASADYLLWGHEDMRNLYFSRWWPKVIKLLFGSIKNRDNVDTCLPTPNLQLALQLIAQLFWIVKWQRIFTEGSASSTQGSLTQYHSLYNEERQGNSHSQSCVM